MRNSDQDLRIRIEPSGSGRTVHAAGALCITTTGELRKALLDGPLDAPTVLDISGLAEADLSGLQMLCAAHKTFRRRGATWEVRGTPAWLHQLASGAGFELECEPGTEDVE